MTADQDQSEAEIPDAAAKPKSREISTVWVIPIIAALIGGWLVFGSATEEKAVAEITFKNASGLEAGKTAVKLRNVKVGVVKDVRFSSDLSKVIVIVELMGVEQKRLTDTTRFWVVKPRVGIGGISGLDTLLSGAYIELDPGEGGVPTNTFTGLEEPENYQLGNPGTTYILNAGELGSLSRESPVRYRDIEVGKVTRYKLSADHSHVEIEIFVRAPHDEYVKADSRFWNTSGLDVEVGAEGIELNLDSLVSLVAGGITFSNNKTATAHDKAPAGSVFKLYDTKNPEFEESQTFGAPMKLYFDNGVSGLSAGAPVEFKGLRLGTVVKVGAEADNGNSDILTYAIIEIEPDRLPTDETRKYLDNEERTKDVYQYIENMVKRGMRAQLKTGNLLTGQSLVALDVFPKEKKTTVKYVEGIPVLPTVPETLAGLLAEVDKIMTRIDALPLETLSTNLAAATENMNSLIKSLNASEGGMMGIQAAETMDELIKAARSIRSAAEYLERHPESLVKGKRPD